MNRERIQSLIDLMKTVPDDKFNINFWTYSCGTPACVAGWATTLPSWQERGRLDDGTPVFEGSIRSRAFAHWAGIGYRDAAEICGSDDTRGKDFYDASTIRPHHVVNALTEYMETHDE